MDWVEWMDDELRPVRQEILEKREAAGEAVEYDTVDLLPENADAASIYMLARNQVVTVADGRPVDVSIVAVKAAMDACGVADQGACLQRVVSVWRMVEAKRKGSAE